MNKLFLNILKGQSISDFKLNVSSITDLKLSEEQSFKKLMKLRYMFDFTMGDDNSSIILNKFNFPLDEGLDTGDIIKAYNTHPKNKWDHQSIIEWVYETYGCNPDGTLLKMKRARVDLYYLMFQNIFE
jgi:hypothetical protein